MSPLALQQSAHSSRTALSLHSLTMRHVLRCPRLARLLGLVLLAGLSACGSPSPETPVSGPTTGSAAAVVAPPAGNAADAGPVAHDPQHQGFTSTTLPGASNRDRATPGAPITNDPRAAQSASDPPPSDAQTTADQAPREARQQWLAELRESPDAGVRLQALAIWAAQPDDDLEPMFEALGDDDEAVRARAEALWEQQLTQEETAAP